MGSGKFNGKSLFGIKLFKMLDQDKISIIRVIGYGKNDDGKPDYDTLIIRDDVQKDKVNTIHYTELEGYTILEPDALLTLSCVTMHNTTSDTLITEDIIVTGTKYLNVKYLRDMKPYCICRQAAYDIFNSNQNGEYYGLAINQDDCPPEIDMGELLNCSKIWHSDLVNMYRTDVLDDILEFVDTTKYDQTLNHIFMQHIGAYKKQHPTDTAAMMGAYENSDKPHYGWCKTLQMLLKDNNFQNDINDMLGITDVDFELKPYIVDKYFQDGNPKSLYYSLSEDLKVWLSTMYKLPISNTFVLEYDHDVNLAEFNNARYFLLRDNTNKLYIVSYNIEGEYKEIEFMAKANELDYSTKFRIKFQNKISNEE